MIISATFKLLSIALLLFVLLLFLMTRKIEERIDLDRKVYLYSGLKSVVIKFVPTENSPFPTGIVWLIGIYFALYAFTSQRYENRLDTLEFRYNTFTTQIGSGATLSNNRLMRLLNEKLPVKPSIFSPKSVLKSFIFEPYFSYFYETYDDENQMPFKSASDFQKIILVEWHTKLNAADFQNVKLNDVDFSNANLNHAKFQGAVLENIVFIGAKLTDASFEDATLTFVQFNGSFPEQASFFKAKLKNVDFSAATLIKSGFWYAEIENVNFTHAELVDASFFYPTTVKKSLFWYANVKGANFFGTQIENAFFDGANLDHTNFERAELKNADFGGHNTEGTETIFTGAQLENATFRLGKFKKASFREAQLEGVDFTYTDLEGADFTDAKFLTAQQLICAENIFGIKISHSLIEEIKKHGCEIMLTETKSKWSTECKKYRDTLLRN